MLCTPDGLGHTTLVRRLDELPGHWTGLARLSVRWRHPHAPCLKGPTFVRSLKICVNGGVRRSNLCQRRSKMGPPWRRNKETIWRLRACPRSPREGPARDAACPQQADAAAHAGGTCGVHGVSSVGTVVGSLGGWGVSTLAALIEAAALAVHLFWVNTVSGSRPSNSWSNSSFSIAIGCSFLFHHYGPKHKILDTPRQHLAQRLAARPEHPRGLAGAHPLDTTRPPDPRVHLHPIHPPAFQSEQP